MPAAAPAHEGFSRSQPSSTTISTLSGRYPSAGELVYPTPIGLQQQFSGFTGINPGAIPSGTHRQDSRQYGYGGGVLFSPYYYPTLDSSASFYSRNDPGQDPAAQSAAATANLLGEQLQRLSSEVEALRQEREMANVPAQATPYEARSSAAATEDQAPPQPPLTLVLRSGKRVQVKSYAVMGQDLWDFSGQPAKRIPLATVDHGASKSATEAAGGEFPELR